jgi:hypothetical protein
MSIESLCCELWPASAARASEALLSLCARFRGVIEANQTRTATANVPASGGFTEKDVLCIAYPDHMGSADRTPLRTLYGSTCPDT